MNTRMREILTEIQRRKDEKEDPCDSCNGSGTGEANKICSDCLGQGILLTGDEYRAILEVAGIAPADLDNDSVLDAETIS